METFELSNELIEKVSQLISKRKNSEIKKIVDGFHYADLAEIIDELDESQRIYLIKLIDSDKTSDVLTELDEDVREKILKTLSPKEIAGEIKEMDSDDAADILDELTDERKEKVISLIKDDNITENIRELLSYDEDFRWINGKRINKCLWKLECINMLKRNKKTSWKYNKSSFNIYLIEKWIDGRLSLKI